MFRWPGLAPAISFLSEQPLSAMPERCDHRCLTGVGAVRPVRRKSMKLKAFLLATSMFTVAGFVGAQAQTLSGQSLSGKVSSTEEGQMEGVLVSAKKEGSTVTTTVVSNDKGEFSFPAGKLEPGTYKITIRAVGYSLVGPKSIDIAAGGATADVKLAKVRNVASQLSNGEWMMSVPGSDQFKASFMLDCQGCHTLQRVFTALHDAD